MTRLESPGDRTRRIAEETSLLWPAHIRDRIRDAVLMLGPSASEQDPYVLTLQVAGLQASHAEQTASEVAKSLCDGERRITDVCAQGGDLVADRIRKASEAILTQAYSRQDVARLREVTERAEQVAKTIPAILEEAHRTAKRARNAIRWGSWPGLALAMLMFFVIAFGVLWKRLSVHYEDRLMQVAAQEEWIKRLARHGVQIDLKTWVDAKKNPCGTVLVITAKGKIDGVESIPLTKPNEVALFLKIPDPKQLMLEELNHALESETK